MLKGRSSRQEGGKLALVAVALQDHITRNLPQIHHQPGPRPPGRRGISGQRGTGHTREEENEYVLDADVQPLTLAQKLGLVPPPCQRLSEQEWAEVKSRCLQEGDVTQPCVICREEFCLQTQVLLSCSHVFHKVCLSSFERYSGRKCCPMCRKEQYETRVIYDGARFYTEKCAVKIQASWRGYAARKWYRTLRKAVPPKDPRLRRHFFEKKFQEISNSLVESCHSDVDAFLHDIERSMASSRDVFCRFDQHCTGVRKMEDDQWMEAQEKAICRDLQDCPICLAPLSSSSSPVLLLSCSHLFHKACLQSFERFCLDARPTCPLCRRRYTTVTV